MQVTFYGVRGSTPATGADYIKYGGNTSCVYVVLADGTHIILDAGTGIKHLGSQLVKDQQAIHLLLSHNHWDHIQGFPFFYPIFQKNREINIYPGLTTPYEPDAILQQFSGSWFPVSKSELLADINIIDLAAEVSEWHIGSAKIIRQKINHPGGGSAYQIEEDGVKLAYVTDNELCPPYKANTGLEQWQAFVDNADLLIHDAQYIEQDMPLKHGWGHSVYAEVIDLARTSKVKQCALYSHDHTRTDEQVDKLISCVQQELQGSGLDVIAAYEGLTIQL